MYFKSFVRQLSKTAPLLLLFSITGLSLPAMGQGTPEPDNEEEGGPEWQQFVEGDIACRVVCTFQPKKNEKFYLKVKDTYEEIYLPVEGISQRLPIRGERIFGLYTQITNEEGESKFVPLVEQVLEGSGGNFLVFLRRTDDLKIASNALNVSPNIYGANKIYVINQTPATLGALIDKSKGVIKPFGSFSYGYQNAARTRYVWAKIFVELHGKATVMSSERLRLVPGRRTILVCFPSPIRAEMGATPMRVLAINDQI